MKNIEQIKKEILELIARGRLKEAIDIMLLETSESYSDKLENEALLLSSRLKKLSSEITKGKISFDEENRERNKITDDALSFLSSLREFYFDNSLRDSEYATDKLRRFINGLRSNRFILSENEKFTEDLKHIFNQVEKSYKVVSKIIVRYIEPAYQKEIAATPFLQFERGETYNMIREGIGHCSIIFQHYENGLRKQLREKLGEEPEEFQELDNIFMSLSHADGDIFAEMASVANFIQTESEKILELLSENKHEEAKIKLLQDRKKLKSLEKSISNGIEEIQELKLKLRYGI